MINRKSSPAPAKKMDFKLPDINHLALDNGLRIIHVQKSKLPIVQLSFLINAGSKFDPEGKSGLSHLTAMMIDEGAGKYNSLQLDDEIEKLGSILSISNNHDALYVSMLTLKENYEHSLELSSLILREPTLFEEDFQREIHKLQNKLKQMYDDPSYIASTVFEKILFKNTFYENPTVGIKSSIENLHQDDLQRFYNTNFNIENTAVIVAGDIEPEETVLSLNKYFSTWKSTTNEKITSLTYNRQKRKIYIVNRPESAQTEIRVGHNTDKRNSNDYFAKLIVNSILGGQFSSRINLNLREDKGYTYGANSSFGYYAAAGLFKVSTAVNIENTMNAVNEIFHEIDGIQKNIKDEEINFTKSYLKRGFPSKFETYGQIASNLNSLVVHELEYDYFNKYLKNISEVTKEEIMNAAKSSLFPQEMIILLVGDKVKILEQINTGDEIVELDIEANELC